MERCAFAPRVGCFDCDVASFCNTWCCFCVSMLLQLPVQRRKKPFFYTRVGGFGEIVCIEIAQVAVCSTTTTCLFASNAQLATNGLFCLPTVFLLFFHTRIGVFALRMLSFIEKVWRLWFVGLVSTIVVLPSITFAMWLPGQRCFWHTGWQFSCLSCKKKAQCQIWQCALWWVLFC